MNTRQPRPAGSDDTASAADDCAQRLSSLLDGELDEAECRELLERLRRDESACRRWALLNCAGDALRSSEVAAWHSHGFVARVAAALDKEPTVLAPRARPASGLRRWLLPGAGVAAAAAVVVAVGLPSRQATEPVVAAAAKIEKPPTVAVTQGAMRIERSPQLERYLAAHRELSEPALMPSSTPYVRTSGTLHQSLQEPR